MNRFLNKSPNLRASSIDDKFVVKNEDNKLKVYRDRLNFVEGSKKLAEKLHARIEEDKRTNQCDLVICMYRDGNKSEETRYLALLSIEISEGLTRKFVQDSQGLEYITYGFNEESLPNIGQKLQKGAFIQQLEPRDYDMLVLDKNREDGTKFFFRTFLGAVQAKSAAQQTQCLLNVLSDIVSKMRPKLEPEKVEYIEQTIQTAVRHERFNIDEFVKQLSIPEEDKKIIEQDLSNNLSDREIEIDKKSAEKFTKKAIYEGEGGLKIAVNRNNKEDMIKVKRVPNKDNPDYLIEIKTKTWKEVLK